MEVHHYRKMKFHPRPNAECNAETIRYIRSEQFVHLEAPGTYMATTMLARNPQVVGMSSPTWEQDPTHLMTHLSPNPYEHSSSTTDDIVEIMNGSPTQLSPHPFDNEGCNNNWLMTNNYPSFVYANGSHYMNAGGQSPDSGIYSPDHSPHSIELPETRIQPMCTTLPMTLASTAELAQGPGCIRDYPPITTSSSYHQHHSEMFAVPSSTSLAPYSQAYDLFTSNMPSNYPQTYSSDVQEHGGLDPIPIISCDQATGNPIRFYECGSDSPQHSFVDSPTYHPNGPFHTIKSADPPVKEPKRAKKIKPQVHVDPSDIKDVPASAQLWEFLLKVLKKPKYNYMVSWESRKDGLFRFHDPSAFAALWGRHRNRPNMTYDKVARALRYYYRREILEPVGGRLTYKFTPRLCKQFTDKHHHHTSATSST